MPFIEPMFAASMPKKLIITPDQYAMEEKYDGHRLIVEVAQNGIFAWSRNGLARALPAHLTITLSEFPVGIYDGELFVPGHRSYGVTEIVNGPNLVYTVFDLLRFKNSSMELYSYDTRREFLSTIFDEMIGDPKFPIKKAQSLHVHNMVQVQKILEKIWARDGEGLILKRRDLPYLPGKRPKDSWIKIKQLRSAVLTVVGFVQSRGQINNRGPYAMVLLRDDAGNETAVKTKNDAECRKFEQEAPVQGEFTLGDGPKHPAIGRRLRCEYQERTPDGSYRHIRWDRWENE